MYYIRIRLSDCTRGRLFARSGIIAHKKAIYKAQSASFTGTMKTPLAPQERNIAPAYFHRVYRLVPRALPDFSARVSDKNKRTPREKDKKKKKKKRIERKKKVANRRATSSRNRFFLPLLLLPYRVRAVMNFDFRDFYLALNFRGTYGCVEHTEKEYIDASLSSISSECIYSSVARCCCC